MKALVLTLFLIITIQARQNPFFPSEGEVDIPFTSNTNTSLDPLKRATIAIPSQARVVKKITVEYLNLDGSFSNSSISLNNSVDWHLPIFVSQSMGDIELNKTPKQNIQKKVKTSTKKTKSYEKLYSLGFITFYKKDKEFKVVTDDKLIRNFLLTSPHRIVMDFAKDANMKSRVKKLNTKYYKKISFGSHKNYYRIVLELDGLYRYKKESDYKSHSFLLY